MEKLTTSELRAWFVGATEQWLYAPCQADLECWGGYCRSRGDVRDVLVAELRKDLRVTQDAGRQSKLRADLETLTTTTSLHDPKIVAVMDRARGRTTRDLDCRSSLMKDLRGMKGLHGEPEYMGRLLAKRERGGEAFLTREMMRKIPPELQEQFARHQEQSLKAEIEFERQQVELTKRVGPGPFAHLPGCEYDANPQRDVPGYFLRSPAGGGLDNAFVLGDGISVPAIHHWRKDFSQKQRVDVAPILKKAKEEEAGGGKVKQVEAAMNKAGYPELISIGKDGKIYRSHRMDNGKWIQWTPLSDLNSSVKSISVARNVSGELEVFALTDQGVFRAHQVGPGGAWARWEGLSQLDGAASEIKAGHTGVMGGIVLYARKDGGEILELNPARNGSRWQTAGRAAGWP